MINVGASFFSFTIDRAQVWEKASVTLDQILRSSLTKWTAAIGGVCLAAYAISRVRAPLVKLDKQLALLESNPEGLLKLFQELVPARGHWFYAKRWTALKAHLESHPNLVETFCEKLIEHQIADPKHDWLLPASELISFEQLSTLYNVTVEDLKEDASDLAEALEYPPEHLATMGSTLKGYATSTGTYLAQALHSFSTTFLRAHDFSSDENQSLVQRHEARWHLNNFYEILEKPAFLILGIYTFLEPKTQFSWVPYVGTLCAILGALYLIKFFQAFFVKKKTDLSFDVRNLTEEAKRGTLPIPSDRSDVVSKMIKCFKPLNQNSLNILLIGPPGVGKDASVQAFVHEMIHLEEDVDVHTMNTSSLKEPGGGTGHLYLNRIQILLRDLQGQEHRNIMFLNEIHTLKPTKDQAVANPSELGQQFKTELETGRLHVIGATTEKEYQDHIEWDKALDRRFVKIFLKRSLTCAEILENYLAEAYPTVTVEKEAIELALTETDKISPETAQPAKAKTVLAQAANSVISNYGKEEEALVKQSAELTKERRLLKRNPINTAKARAVAKLADEVQKKEAALNEKREELKSVSDLKHDKVRAQEQFTRLAHRISAKPDKSDLEMKTFLLVRRLLDKTQETIEIKERELEAKGRRVRVTAKLVEETLLTADHQGF